MNSVFVDKSAGDSGQKKLVGVYIKKINADRIALLSLKEGVPRTAILKQILGDYLKDKPSLPEMIEQAVERAVAAWKKDGKPGLNSNLAVNAATTLFLHTISNDLKSNRIDPELILQIIEQIKDRINEKKSSNKSC